MSDSFKPARGAARYERDMKVRKVTPIYFVERIEPALPVWAKLGFRATVEVPHDDRLGFVILADGEREIMLQSRASARVDLGAAAVEASCALYCDVESVAAARDACAAAGARVVIADRTTSYGAREAWLVDPCGVLVGFAEHGG
jgi:uncharacterized glyoxalase superfamily protein PhnB